MDLFGPVSVRSINRKSYCLVVTDDFSRFSWVFFLATKDETLEILKNFITGIENQSDHKVKTIRSDNGTKFKNRIMNEFCEMKGIRREFSSARTPQQNGVAKRKNMTLIEAGRKLALNFMRLFGCPVTILNTLDHLGNQTNDNAEDEIADNAGKKNGVEDPAKEDDINGPGEAINTNNTNRLNIVSSPINIVSSSFTIVDLGRARDQRNKFESVFGQDKDANSTYRMFTPVSAAEYSYENLGGLTHVNVATPSNVDYPTDPLMPDLEDTTDLQDTGIFGNAYDDEDVSAEADLNNLETTINVSLIPTTRIHKDHPKEQIIRDINSATQIRSMIKMSEEHAMIIYINKQRRINHKDYQNCLFACFLSQMEPKKVIQALADSSWVEAMQEELLQFRLQKVYRNKKDERGIVVRNKERLVTQEEGIDYDEVFDPVARIEAIRLFLAYASFMRFIMYQMDVKSAFLYGITEEEVYVCQPPGFEDPQFPNKVYKVDKALYDPYQALRACQDKYVADILKTVDFSSVKIASTPLETNKALIKDEEAEDVDILKRPTKLGLWYPKDSPFDLEALLDSDYAEASLDRKSTIGGCQFLGKRLISWQCKKQTTVANSINEAEYVVAANCCRQ
ncbi:putative ribonuclease H-like domain-containing protein, partial [Tanacetum coccineum]